MARGRPREPLLSRELIVATALEQIDSGAELSLNKIAKELGVHLSSLANHVGDRENLIELLRLHVARQYPATFTEDAPWQEALRDTATAMRTAFTKHPHLITYLAHKAISSPEVLDTYSRLAERLVTSGFSNELASLAIRFVDILTLGSGLEVTEKTYGPEGWTSSVDDATAVEDATAVPKGPDAAESEAAFQLALRLYISGLEREMADSGR